MSQPNSLGLNDTVVLVQCENCHYKTLNYTLGDIAYFIEDTKGGMPECPYCGYQLTRPKKGYIEL